MVYLAENIKKVAREHGKTMLQIAQEMGVAQPHISRTINNPRITYEDLTKIANIIGCEIQDFFNEQKIVCPHCGKEIKVELKLD